MKEGESGQKSPTKNFKLPFNFYIPWYILVIEFFYVYQKSVIKDLRSCLPLKLPLFKVDRI